MKLKHRAIRALSLPQSALAVSFYDAACDYSRETFEQITNRLPAVRYGSVIEAVPAPRNRRRQLGRRRLGFAVGQLTLCTTLQVISPPRR